jgi:hypothetical protein
MMDYVIKKNNDVWDIYETQTDLIVKTCSTAQDAQIMKTKLNRGGGFSGWTPAFFLENISSSPQKL